jgi:hypothetical protein
LYKCVGSRTVADTDAKKNVIAFYYPMLLSSGKTSAFWRVSRLLLFVLLVRATCS